MGRLGEGKRGSKYRRKRKGKEKEKGSGKRRERGDKRVMCGSVLSK